jgi:hypothetical protein
VSLICQIKMLSLATSPKKTSPKTLPKKMQRQVLAKLNITLDDNTLNPCTDCGKLVPQYGLNCNGGSCTSCAAAKYIGWRGMGYCIECLSLISTDNTKMNNQQHANWDVRKYHKKCWIQHQANK